MSVADCEHPSMDGVYPDDLNLWRCCSCDQLVQEQPIDGTTAIRHRAVRIVDVADLAAVLALRDALDGHPMSDVERAWDESMQAFARIRALIGGDA